MNKFTYVVGDLHGRYEVVDKMLNLPNKDTQVVFLGDYLDSYTRSSKDCIYTLMLVNGAIAAGKNVVGLLGNHEMSYLDSRHRCSGWNPVTAQMLYGIHETVTKNFKNYHWVGDFLLTHAGVSARILELPEELEGKRKEVLALYRFFESPAIHNIGKARGGWHNCGGMFWCDWNHEFEPLEYAKQVVGHTRSREKGVRQKGNSYCIDCLENGDDQVLLIKDGKEAEIVNLEDL